MSNLNPKPRQYPGEPDHEYRQRVREWYDSVGADNKQQREDQEHSQIKSDRDIHETARILTLQKLRKRNAEVLFTEVVELAGAGVPRALVTHKPRRMAPSKCDQVYLSCGNFYRECEEAEALLTLMPDQLNGWRRPKHIKRIKKVEIGMRGRLFWALDIHPLGWSVPDNWLCIIDDSLTTMTTEQLNNMVEGTSSNVVQPQKGKVTSVTASAGALVVSVVLDNGSTITVQMLIEQAPKLGDKGTVIYDDEGNAAFAIDGAEQSGNDGE